VILVSDL